jgi:LacI family transcriptional regulator
MAKRPTLADVAAEAGISRALASIVLRGAPGASDATRERVLAVASSLGYRPDARARLLRSSRSGLLGVVFALDGDFHSDLVDAIYPAAETAGYSVALSARGPRRTEAQALQTLLDLNVEALLVLGPAGGSAHLTDLPVPAVPVLDPSPAAGLSAVMTDEAEGVRLALEHLWQLGHRRIVHTGGGKASGADARESAYTDFMHSRGQESVVLPGGDNEATGISAAPSLASLLKEGAGATALLAFNDAQALGLVHGLRTLGVEVPRNLSVVGYDDSHLAALAYADLTSVRQDPDALAAAAVRVAVGVLEGRHEQVLVAPSLTVRSSTAAPARA